MVLFDREMIELSSLVASVTLVSGQQAHTARWDTLEMRT